MSLHSESGDEAPQLPLAARQPRNQLPNVSLPAPLARSQLTSELSLTVNQVRASLRHRVSPIVRVFIDFCTCAGFFVGVLGLVLVVDQTQLVAKLVVGMVLLAVFGTPLLCVCGIVGFYVWAMTRVRHGRAPQRSMQSTATSSQPSTVVVSEVILDE